MARQLASRTVVQWFSNLSFDEQKDVLGQIEGRHQEARSAKKAELEMQLAALGYSAPNRRGRPRKNPLGSGNGRPLKTRRGGKVKAKYRDPKTNETWSGRGRMASWLKAKEEAGEKLEKYLV